MSIEFVKKGVNKASVVKANTQEQQIRYFSRSELQDNGVSEQYLQQWASRKFQTNDYFLNYVKSLFKTDNFLSFVKYLRKPLPSSKIVRNKIEPQLNRVFYSENSSFKYSVSGKEEQDFIPQLAPKKFNSEILHNLIYYHNSILVTLLDAEKENTPYRKFIDIGIVKSIEIKGDTIIKIAYTGSIEFDGKVYQGDYYIDDKEYKFYESKDSIEPLVAPHDLGHCPAHFIAANSYHKADAVVRESLLTFVRDDLESYTFLKTIQKMTEPNGAIPVAVTLNTDNDSNKDVEGIELEPNITNAMSSQKAEVASGISGKGSGILQVGTVHAVPRVEKIDGSIDMDIVSNFIKFHYIPAAQLKYFDEKVKLVEIDITSTIVGTIDLSGQPAKNEMQTEQGYVALQNTLTSLSSDISRIRKLSDYDMLALAYGKEAIQEIYIDYGNKFFLETETKLLKDLEIAPNIIERQNIITKLNMNRYKNNQEEYVRQSILYSLMPYIHDKDFDKAIAQQQVTDVNKQYQLRFTYWISVFEATYGDIVEFYAMLEGSNEDKKVLINNLIIKIITDEQAKNIITPNI
jgi:hypothetical protein